MATCDQRILKEKLQKFGRRSTLIALGLFLFDVFVYLSALSGVIFLESIYLKITCSVIAATMISALFVIGHDAAHGAFTDSKKLNDLIGRIVFLPSLHNYSMWQVVHNKLHHGNPNLKNLNSWSPMSFDEYRSSSKWKRFIERLYRTPLGFGPYYLLERWWKFKFYPWDDTKRRKTYLKDFGLLIGFLALLVGSTIAGTFLTGHSSLLINILLTTIVPFVIWNFSMGWTVYIQHTHQKIPWFKNREQWDRGYDYGEFTPYTLIIKFPRWFGYLFHDINEHTAHHLAPKIPCYKLFAAQQLVEKELGAEMVAEKFSIRALLKRMKECKLYDFDKHRWTDFNGQPTTRPIAVSRDVPIRIAGGSSRGLTLSSVLALSQPKTEFDEPKRAIS